MQDLVGMEVSAIKSDGGALQAHEKFHRGGHKLSIFHWGLRSIAGSHYFPKISLGCIPVHPGGGSNEGYDIDTAIISKAGHILQND